MGADYCIKLGMEEIDWVGKCISGHDDLNMIGNQLI